MEGRSLADLAKGQQPYATILGCSDSRVPPELVFDTGLGELFIVRVAGNVLGPAIKGTLQYASAHLHTPLFVVLGHEGCGAVQAALAAKFHGTRHPSQIEILLENIFPALDGLDATLPAESLLQAAVEANVRWTMRVLRKTPEGRAHAAAGVMKLVGAVYELGTGRVRFLRLGAWRQRAPVPLAGLPARSRRLARSPSCAGTRASGDPRASASERVGRGTGEAPIALDVGALEPLEYPVGFAAPGTGIGDWIGGDVAVIGAGLRERAVESLATNGALGRAGVRLVGGLL